MSGMCSSSYHFLKSAGVMLSGLLIWEDTQRMPGVGVMVVVSCLRLESSGMVSRLMFDNVSARKGLSLSCEDSLPFHLVSTGYVFPRD